MCSTRLARLVGLGACLSLLSAPALAQPAKRPKVAVLDVRTAGTFDPKGVEGLSELIASEASKEPIQIIAGSDLTALIGFERQRKLLGCTESGCLAEIGGAMGVDYLLMTQVSQVGGVWLLSMNLLDVAHAQAVKRQTERAKDAGALVDVSIASVHQVLGALVAKSAEKPPEPLPPKPEPKVVAQAQAAEVAPAPPSGSARHTVGYVLIGAGGAALATGVGFGVLAKKSYDNAKDATTQKAQDELKSTTRTRMNVADALYVTSAVALGVGLYLALTGTSSSGAAVSAVAAPGGGAIVVSGGF